MKLGGKQMYGKITTPKELNAFSANTSRHKLFGVRLIGRLIPD